MGDETINPEKWLWVDPFTEIEAFKNRLKSGAVLLAEDIARYVTEFNVIVDNQDYVEGEKFGAKLKGASYTMSPHPNGAWRFDHEGRLLVLEAQGDKSNPYYDVPHHSLVYIKLRQKLRVPFYLIGRHNLKITYVYKGLLLGTGPQVDPGYAGNLIIPLHNFTEKDVSIYINDSFVSIDFVRTSPLVFEGGVPDDIDALYRKYGQSKHLLDRDKVLKRTHLEEYLEGAKPQSALVKIVSQNERNSKDLKDLKKLAETSIESLDKKQQEHRGEVERITSQIRKEEVEFESHTTSQLERAGMWRRIEAIAIVIAVAALVVTMITWVCNYHGAFDGRLFSFEKRVSAFEQGTITNIEKSLQNQASNNLTTLLENQMEFSNNLANVKNKMNALEGQIKVMSDQLALMTSNHLEIPKK